MLFTDIPNLQCNVTYMQVNTDAYYWIGVYLLFFPLCSVSVKTKPELF